MPRINIYDHLHKFVVDIQHAGDVVPYLDEHKISYTQSYHGDFIIRFNKRNEGEAAMLFKLKFGDIARVVTPTLMIDLDDDDDVS